MHIPLLDLVLLLFIAALFAILRGQITDARLEHRRLKAGDLTIVSDYRGTEQMLRDRAAKAANGAQQAEKTNLGGYFEQRERYLSDSSVAAIDGILEEEQRANSSKQAAERSGLWRPRRWRQPEIKVSELEVTSLAARAIVAPATVFTRVSERRTLDHERAAVTLTRTIEGTEELRGLFLVPVLRIPKGQLLGSLTVTVNGEPARTIPMTAGRGTIVRALRSMILRVVAAGAKDLRSLLRFAENVTPAILSDLATEGALRAEWLSDFDERIQLEPAHEQLLEWLRSLADIAMATDTIFAVIPNGCARTVKLTVVYDEPYRVPANSIARKTRRLIGIGLTEFRIDLHRASEAQTYHLDVRGAPSTYFEQADVVFPDGAASVSADFSRSELLHISPLRGDAHAHVYWRDFGVWAAGKDAPAGLTTPRFHLRLRERPPGLNGPILALSLWIWLITWTVGYFFPALFAYTNGTQNAWTTLILAAPALLTGWLLSRLNAETVRVMSVSTFTLVVWLSANVAMTVTIAALTMSGVRTSTIVPYPGVEIYHYDWVLLLFSTFAHFLASGILFFGRGLRYAKTINERVTE